MNQRSFLGILGSASLVALVALGCGETSASPGAGGAPGTGGAAGVGGTGGDGGFGFEPPEFGTWVKYEPDGAICSNGSPYKFWVKFSETSDDVILFFEGGGACWDYDSCAGNTGIRGAANRDGLRDDYADVHRSVEGLIDVPVQDVYPLLNDDPDVSPMADWNKVFVPYCTGDIYGGTRTETYEGPAGEELEFHHVGHLNILAMTEMLDEMFQTVPRMFVGGCSAGGAGSIANYYFLRTGITGVQKGYLLDDSGPVFPSREPTSRSLPLYERIRPSWDVDAVIDSGPEPEILRADFGQLATLLADEFPEDRLATTVFRMDYNFSLYSYERFYTLNEGAIVPFDGINLGLDEDNWLDRNAVHTLFWDDIALFRDLVAPKDNFGYYLPFYRDTNDSHCVTVPGFEDVSIIEALDLYENDFGTLAWLGSDIGDMNLRDFVEELLDGEGPVGEYFEEDAEGHYASCAPTEDYDETACRDAVCERLGADDRVEQGCPGL